MKNNMKLIMESWRQTTLLEGVAAAIQNKDLDPKAIEEIGEKLLSDNKGFKLAVQIFSDLGETDPKDTNSLGEGALDWVNSKIIQGMIMKDNLVDTLKSDSRFAPVLKLGGPALALAFLYYKNETGGIDPNDFTRATEIIAKKGQVGLEGLANATLNEKIERLRSPNG